MASPLGEVTGALVGRYDTLSQGGIGLIIPGYMFVHPLGRGARFQTGIHSDDMLPGLTRLAEVIHGNGGRVAFQLHHAGRQTSKDLAGQTPIGPSRTGRDPVFLTKPRQMDTRDIEQAIEAFGDAAGRAARAGADAVQLHAAHGYLIDQFLSPFFNRRTDGWGGTAAGRFRLLREIVLTVRDRLPRETALLVKLNADDHIPRRGITPPLAALYAGWLADLGVDAIELSCGTTGYSVMNMARGTVPAAELARALPRWERLAARLVLASMAGKYALAGAYNLEAAGTMRAAIGQTPLVAVGGFRTLAQMEWAVNEGGVDCVAMCRPFIREPFLIQKFLQGTTDSASCISCNKCLAATINELPVRCYVQGLPAGKRSAT